MLFKQMRNSLRKIFKAIALIIVCYILFLATIECYNPFFPFIDTKFSSGFNENVFDQINIGDSADSVETKLGSPIWKIGCGGCWDPQSYVKDNEYQIPVDRTCNEPCNSENQHWQFSDDGACSWHDFAWKNFTLIIQDNKVIEKKSWWLYD